MTRVVFFVLPGEADGPGRWRVKFGNKEWGFDTQLAATEWATELARVSWEKRRVPSQVRVEGADGRSQLQHAFGLDPSDSLG